METQPGEILENALPLMHRTLAYGDGEMAANRMISRHLVSGGVPGGRGMGIGIRPGFDLSAYEKFLGGTLEDYEYPAAKVEEALAALPKR